MGKTINIENNICASFSEKAVAYYIGRLAVVKRNALIGNFHYDIYLQDHNTVIEYNGEYFHEMVAERDAQKASNLRQKGIRLIRIIEGEEDNIDGDTITRKGNAINEHLVYAIQKTLKLLGFQEIVIDFQKDALEIDKSDVSIRNRRERTPLPPLDIDGIEWRDVVGYENLYEVSNYGHVRTIPHYVNNHTGRILLPAKLLKPNPLQKGYYQVTIAKDGKRSAKQIHRLVAEAFLKHSKGCNIVNHKNGNPQDNRAENLEWVDDGGNQRHAYAHGLSRRHFCRGGALKRRKVALIDESGNIERIFTSIRAAEVFAGGVHGNMGHAVRGQHRGEDRRVFGKRYVYLEDAPKFANGQMPYGFVRCKTVLQFTLDGKLVAEHKGQTTAGRSVGVTAGAISSALKSKTHISAGYIWNLKE